MDGDYGDIQEVCCENGHSFASDCFPDTPLTEEQYATIDEKFEDWRECVDPEDVTTLSDLSNLDDGFYDLSSKFCPLCALEYILDVEIVKYLCKELDITKDQVKTTIRERFKDFDELKEYLKQE
jgi:hypothetical protein